MKVNLDKYCSDLYDTDIVVADIGSMNINGSYRELVPERWTYLGVDREAGRGVDVVMTGEYNIPMEDNSVDLVVSGQCLEHVNNPFKLVTEAARILKPGGLMLLVAPFIFIEHGYPVDCFRFLPDGMKAIMVEAGIEPIHAYRNLAHKRRHLQQEDCWGIGIKP